MNIAVYLTVLFCLLHTGQALLPVCPLVKCSTVCKEYALDKNGCQTCNCKALLPVCPLVKCSAVCKEYALDKNGCQTCNCKECKPVLCKMYCPHGWAVDENGCEICKCRSCEPVRCRMYCKYGWDVNEHGCEICKCKVPCDGEKPLQGKDGNNLNCGRGGERCPANYFCDIHPTDRYAVCCPKCKPVLCKLKCPYGWDVDENGCEICKCRWPCDGEKPLQNEDGENLYCGRGGKRCPANSFCDIHPTDRYAVCCPKCEPVLCKMKCPYGWDVDEIGCEICKCRWPCDGEKPLQGKDGNSLNCGRGGEPCPANSYCDIHPTDRYAVCCPKCSPVMCDLYCEHGFQIGKDGCEICVCKQCPDGVPIAACKKDPCEGATCSNPAAKRCKANYCGGCNAVWYDSNDQVVKCGIKECSPVLCKMYCEHGFQVGKDGCEICSCRPCPKGVDLVACLKNPCDGATCANGLGKTCKANYCGGCNAVWYNSNYQVVNCNTKG